MKQTVMYNIQLAFLGYMGAHNLIPKKKSCSQEKIHITDKSAKYMLKK